MSEFVNLVRIIKSIKFKYKIKILKIIIFSIFILKNLNYFKFLKNIKILKNFEFSRNNELKSISFLLIQDDDIK